MKTLADAIALAAHAHEGQRDKAGRPYILHPLRLMLKMRTEAEMMAAVLHDVVEDTPTTLDDLRRQGFPAEVVAAVDRLTRREDESYDAFIARVKPDALACRVKIADLEDNMDLKRIPHPTERDLARVERYRRAMVALKARI